MSVFTNSYVVLFFKQQFNEELNSDLKADDTGTHNEEKHR